MGVAILAWTLGIIVVLAGGIVGLVSTRIGATRLGALVLVPVLLGAAVTGARLAPAAPAASLRFALDVAWVLLAVTGGAPIVQLVLARTHRGGVREGSAGGILVDGAGEREPTEVMRGGGTIGYLERFATAAAIGLGQVTVIAALIALKGLGRFGELGSAAARERFIIGTLASLIWACCCGALISLG